MRGVARSQLGPCTLLHSLLSSLSCAGAALAHLLRGLLLAAPPAVGPLLMPRVRTRGGVAPADASACFGLQVVLLVLRRSAGSAERETLLGSGICSRAAKRHVGSNRGWQRLSISGWQVTSALALRP